MVTSVITTVGLGASVGFLSSYVSDMHIWSDPSVGDTGKLGEPLDIWSKDEFASVHP